MRGGLNILSAGMVTAVGLNRAASCAAMRGNIDGFQETRFFSNGTDALIGAPVPMPRNWIGERRLAHLAAGAIVDALDRHWSELGRLLLVLCVAESDRPRPGLLSQSMAARQGLWRSTACVRRLTKTRPITR